MFSIKKSVVYDMISIAKSQTAEYQRIRLYFLLCSFPSVPAQHFRAWTPPPVQHLLGSASSCRSKTVRILHSKSTNCFPLFFVLSPRNVRIKLHLRFLYICQVRLWQWPWHLLREIRVASAKSQLYFPSPPKRQSAKDDRSKDRIAFRFLYAAWH